MKTASITFNLTLDIAYSDFLDEQWIADSFLHNSKRFSVSEMPGDPDNPGSIIIQAASSGVADIKKFAKGHDEVKAKSRAKSIFVAPELAMLIANNPEFIEALCEEGVVEWLTPFVLTKSRQGAEATEAHKRSGEPFNAEP